MSLNARTPMIRGRTSPLRATKWWLVVTCLTFVLMPTACAHVRGKTVVRKDAPNFLVADDGSICVVSKERFEKTQVGMKALCAWKGATMPLQ